MDWSQIAFGSCLAVACYFGRGDLRIILVMVANFIATITLSDFPLAVGVADMACCVVLALGSSRARVVAAFFVAMTATYPVCWLLGVSNSATYTLVDALAYLQLVVVGRGDHGIGFGLRALNRLRHRSGFPVVEGVATARRFGVVEKDRG